MNTQRGRETPIITVQIYNFFRGSRWFLLGVEQM